MSTNDPLTLRQLNLLVKNALQTQLPGRYWLKAELSDVRVNASGHCYVEFVQKDDDDSGTLAAKARGTIWSQVFHLLQPYFTQVTGQALCAGMKVLVQVSPTFHELYGYSLTIHDIDPTYTMGDLAQRRQAIIRQLTADGIADMNRTLAWPRLPQRIAIVSSATAAGYGDFVHQLTQNPYGFAFRTRLFEAVMQGNQVESSIMDALDRIYAEANQWDIVVIIRGGGAVTDLSGFDSYALAAHVAQFPLPIVTGIGHERDDTVIDLVSHTRVKTPTAAASLIVAKMADIASWVEKISQRMTLIVPQRLHQERQRLLQVSQHIPLQAKLLLQRHLHRIDVLNERISAANPKRLLKRGYSLTTHQGKIVKKATELHRGDIITTQLATGKIQSTVL